MIMGYYEGLHFLNLLDSFRHVAWLSQYTVETLDDPVLECISHFKQRCFSKNVRLENSKVWLRENFNWQDVTKEYGPFIFVISGYSEELSFNKIFKWVEEGSNLVLLYSTYLYSQYEQKYQEILNTLSISSIEFGEYSKEQKDMRQGQGRIIFIHNDDINDCNVEGGPFGLGTDSEKKIVEAFKKMDNVIDNISTFSIPCVDCVIRSVPESWPKDEALVIEIEIKNRSFIDINSVYVDILLADELEPISNTTIELNNFKAGTSNSVTILVVPRTKDVITNPVNVKVEHDGITRLIYLPSSQINVLDNLQNLLRSSKPTQIDLSKALPQYEAYFQAVASPTVILQLLDIDPDAVVAKIRRIGEYISKLIAQKYINNFNETWKFAMITSELYKQRVIKAKAKGYIDTIRVFGNLASHANISGSTTFSHEDALVVCHALVLFLKEVTENHIL